MSTQNATPPPLPSGLNYIAAIEPALTFILIITPLSAILVTVLVLLIFFSSPGSRSQPVFYLNVFACLLGLLHGILNGIVEVDQILRPSGLKKPLYIAEQVVTVVSPVFIDTILLTRVLAFHPRKTTIRRDLFIILAFPVVAKLVRISCEITWLVKNDREISQFGSIIDDSGILWYRNPLLITDFLFQVLDNAYCSIFFLYKLRLFDKAGRSGWVSRHPTTLSKIRGLFYIALGTFLFPIALNIAQIILVICDRSFLRVAYLQVANTYISAIGLVFATVWTTGRNWSKSMAGSNGSTWNEYSNDEIELGRRCIRGRHVHAVKLPSKASVIGMNGTSIVEENSSIVETMGKQCPHQRPDSCDEFMAGQKP